MSTLREILSDIQMRVTAARPTDDSRFNLQQAAFVLNYVSARTLNETSKKEIAASDDRYNYKYNPVLWKEYTLSVSTSSDGRKYVTLPFPPAALPLNFGVQSVYTKDPKKPGLKQFKRGSFSSAETGRKLDFAQPQFVHKGLDLDLYNIGIINEVQVVAINAGLDTSNESLDATYPLSQDMLYDVINEVVRVLLNQQGMQDDFYNDGKDDSGKTKQ